MTGFCLAEGYDALGLLRPAQVDINADAAQHGVNQFLAYSGVETSNDIDREIEAARNRHRSQDLYCRLVSAG